MTKHKKTVLIFLSVITLNACSFVSLDPQARDVAVSPNTTSLKNCKFLGDTTVSLWSKAATFQSDTTVKNQLDTLARNQGANMGGNVVIFDSTITDNQKIYHVYKCTSHNTESAAN